MCVCVVSWGSGPTEARLLQSVALVGSRALESERDRWRSALRALCAALIVAMDGPENRNNLFNSVPQYNTRSVTRIAAADGGAHGLTNRAADTPVAPSREHAPADLSSPVLASDAVASLTTTDTQTRQDLSASNRSSP